MARRVDYYFRETVSGLRRNGVVTFAAISTVFISLFLLGGALLIGRQTDLLIEAQAQNVEVAVFLLDDISGAQRLRLNDKIANMPEVDTVVYESKEEAYRNFKELFANQPELWQNVGPDALPASFRVKLVDPERFDVIAARLEGEPGIEEIRDQRKLLRQFFAVASIFRFGVGATAIIMLVSAAGLIANTVRMALFARRKEIGIMKLVGATNWYIRIPFLVEGMVQGLIGAGVALAAIFTIKALWFDALRGQIGFIPLLQTGHMIFIVPLMLVAGVVVAAAASLFAMRRFLDV